MKKTNDRDEFEPRMNRWAETMRTKLVRDSWIATRMNYSPNFRDEVDKIVEINALAAQAAAQ